MPKCTYVLIIKSCYLTEDIQKNYIHYCICTCVSKNKGGKNFIKGSDQDFA